MAGNFDYDRKKKDTVVCWREIGNFFVVAGNFHYDREKKDSLRPEKKRYSRLSDGCAVLAITTRKKKIQSSVWRVVLLYQFLVLAENWQFFCCGGKFSLRPEKKRYSHLSGGCAIIITTGKKRYICLSVGCAVLAITTGKKKDTVVCLAGCAVVLCQFLVLAGKW